MITEQFPTMPLSRLRDLALFAAGVSLTVLAVLAIVLVLVLYPRVSRATANLEQASASAVVVSGNLETVTGEMVAITEAIRAGADRIRDAGDRVRDLTVGLRGTDADIDVQLGELSGQVERFREQADQVDALLSRFGR